MYILMQGPRTEHHSQDLGPVSYDVRRGRFGRNGAYNFCGRPGQDGRGLEPGPAEGKGISPISCQVKTKQIIVRPFLCRKNDNQIRTV